MLRQYFRSLINMLVLATCGLSYPPLVVLVGTLDCIFANMLATYSHKHLLHRNIFILLMCFYPCHVVLVLIKNIVSHVHCILQSMIFLDLFSDERK